MNGKQKIFVILMVILAVSLACDLSPVDGNSPNEPSDGAIETTVAETLAAIGDGGSDGDGSEPDPEDPVAPIEPSAPSPDPHIVYVDDGDLWLWTEAGGNVELYTGETVDKVIISPDAQVVAFTTVGTDFMIQGLWRVYTDGTGIQKMISGPDFVAMATDAMALGTRPYLWEFIPNSHVLAFNTKLVLEGPGLLIQDDIRHLDLDTGVLSTFLPPDKAGNFYYSPDGSRIAFTDSESVNLINADGTNRQDDVLTFPFVNTASEFSFYPVAQWAPDSSQLWVVIPSSEPFGPAATFEIFSITADGMSTSSVGVFPGAAAHFNAGNMIAPDGSAVVYFQHAGSGQDLYAGVIGGSDTLYANGVNDTKGWSLDSTYFVYGTTAGDTMLGQVGAATVLLEPAFVSGDVIWLEDGRVVYAAGTTGSYSLRLGTPGAGSVLIAAPAGNFLSFDAVP